MDNYEVNIFQQPYVLIKLIDIIFDDFLCFDVFYTKESRYIYSHTFKKRYNLLDSIIIIVPNAIIINKVKSITLINYKIKNNFLFLKIIKRYKENILLNNDYNNILMKILNKKKISSLHEYRIIEKYNEILKRKN
jgi:hypothetical protein